MLDIKDARRPFTAQQAYEQGWTVDSIKWALKAGRLQKLTRGVYVNGPDKPTKLELALGQAISAGSAGYLLAGLIHKLDAADNIRGRILKRPSERTVLVRGYPCTDGLETLLDLATCLTDIQWEQALECALHNKLCSLAQVEDSLQTKRYGNSRVRRVLTLRPPGAPPCESMLETMAVQLIRTDPLIPTPTRQVKVFNKRGVKIARVDLAWPEHNAFLELDGEDHENQPRYDARRQTRVVTATRWNVGRFTWSDIEFSPEFVLSELRDMFDIAPSISKALSA